MIFAGLLIQNYNLMKVAVVGATGLVGGEILEVLEEEDWVAMAGRCRASSSLVPGAAAVLLAAVPAPVLVRIVSGIFTLPPNM